MLNYLQKYYRPVSFICACTMLQSKKGPQKVNTVFSGRRSNLLVYLAIYSERCLTSYLLRRMSTQLYIPKDVYPSIYFKGCLPSYIPKDVYTAIYSERCLPSNIFLRMPLPTQLYIPKHDYSAIYSEGCLPSYSIYSNNVYPSIYCIPKMSTQLYIGRKST